MPAVSERQRRFMGGDQIRLLLIVLRWVEQIAIIIQFCEGPTRVGQYRKATLNMDKQAQAVGGA